MITTAYPSWPSAEPDPLAGPFMTSRQLTDYSDEPGYAIPPVSSATTQLMTRLLAGED
jgi:hypothetical protein